MSGRQFTKRLARNREDASPARLKNRDGASPFGGGMAESERFDSDERDCGIDQMQPLLFPSPEAEPEGENKPTERRKK